MAVVAVTKESRAGETRVAMVPDTVRKLIGLGVSVVVERGAGEAATFLDADYEAAGATMAGDAASVLKDADILFKVRAPDEDEVAALKDGAIVVALLNPYNDGPLIHALARKG